MTPQEIIETTKQMVDGLKPNTLELHHHVPDNRNMMTVSMEWETDNVDRTFAILADILRRVDDAGWSPNLHTSLKAGRYRSELYEVLFEVNWIADYEIIEHAFAKLAHYTLEPITDRPRAAEASSSTTS